jgi:hypothetical protein
VLPDALFLQALGEPFHQCGFLDLGLKVQDESCLFHGSPAFHFLIGAVLFLLRHLRPLLSSAKDHVQSWRGSIHLFQTTSKGAPEGAPLLV